MAIDSPGFVVATFAPDPAHDGGTAEVRHIAGAVSGEFELLGVRLVEQPGGTIELACKVPDSQVQQACSERISALAAASPAALWSAPARVVLGQEESKALSSEVILAQVPAGQREEYRAARRSLDKSMAGFPGFVSVDHYITPEPDGDETWSTVLSFDSAEALAKWRSSEQRAQGVGRVRAAATEMATGVPRGYGSWFSVDEQTRSGPVWKQAMVVVAVIYATVSLLNMTLGRLVGQGFEVDDQPLFPGLGLPFPIVVFIGNVAGTILMTWVLMPYVTRAMDWWLRPTATKEQTRRGLALMLIIYAVEMAVFTTIFTIWKF